MPWYVFTAKPIVFLSSPQILSNRSFLPCKAAVHSASVHQLKWLLGGVFWLMFYLDGWWDSGKAGRVRAMTGEWAASGPAAAWGARMWAPDAIQKHTNIKPSTEPGVHTPHVKSLFVHIFRSSINELILQWKNSLLKDIFFYVVHILNSLYNILELLHQISKKLFIYRQRLTVVTFKTQQRWHKKIVNQKL